jgi:RNA polymerase sigma factor (TIGR02999 family)
VQPELRRLAHRYMRREQPGHTLQTTALVHEAYLKLVDKTHPGWQNRTHFFAVAAQLMRRIIVDHARERRALKRGGAVIKVELDEAALPSEGRAAELLALDEALDRLAAFDPRKCQVVEMRYFGGLTIEEIAEVLNIHPNTALRDWSAARAWLYAELRVEGGETT